jgi:hypothetical protein
MREVLALLATLELGAPTAASEDDPEDSVPGVYLARRWSDGRASFGASTDLAKTFETMRADWGDVEMIHAVVPDEANRTSLVERLGKRMKSDERAHVELIKQRRRFKGTKEDPRGGSHSRHDRRAQAGCDRR